VDSLLFVNTGSVFFEARTEVYCYAAMSIPFGQPDGRNSPRVPDVLKPASHHCHLELHQDAQSLLLATRGVPAPMAVANNGKRVAACNADATRLGLHLCEKSFV